VNIVITGSTRGLGFATAQRLLADGHSVTICSEDDADVERALGSLQQAGHAARGIRCDVSLDEDMLALLHFAQDGGRSIDAWINNAGMPGITGRTDQLPAHYLQRLIDVNIKGTCLGSVHALRAFRSQGYGRLLNVVGRGARSPVPFSNSYGPSKTWIRSFTRAMASEARGSGIVIGTFQPGLVHTQLTTRISVVRGHEHRTRALPIAQRYLGNPPEIAGACMARIITGAMRNGKAYRVPVLRSALNRIRTPPAEVAIVTSVIEPEVDPETPRTGG